MLELTESKQISKNIFTRDLTSSSARQDIYKNIKSRSSNSGTIKIEKETFLKFKEKFMNSAPTAISSTNDRVSVTYLPSSPTSSTDIKSPVMSSPPATTISTPSSSSSSSSIFPSDQEGPDKSSPDEASPNQASPDKSSPDEASPNQASPDESTLPNTADSMSQRSPSAKISVPSISSVSSTATKTAVYSLSSSSLSSSSQFSLQDVFKKSSYYLPSQNTVEDVLAFKDFNQAITQPYRMHTDLFVASSSSKSSSLSSPPQVDFSPTSISKEILDLKAKISERRKSFL